VRGKIKKTALILPLIASILALTFAISPAASQGGTTLAASPSVIADTSLGPGSSFTLNITVHDVTGMLGYEFALFYDTSVLTATSFANQTPFVKAWPSRIDDAMGLVEMSYTYKLPEYFGLDVYSFDPPFTVAKITFTVDNWGISALELGLTKIPDCNGGEIEHTATGGIFTNVGPLPENPYVGLTGAFLEYRHFQLWKDPEGFQTLTGQIENKGTETTSARVKFTVLDSMGGPIDYITTAPSNIAPGQVLRLSADLSVGTLPLKPASYNVGIQVEYLTATGWMLGRHGDATAAKTTLVLGFTISD